MDTRLRKVLVIGVTAVMLAAAGCGGSGVGGGDASQSDVDVDFAKKAQRAVDAAAADQSDSAPPTNTPTVPTGKTIVAIPATMAAESCARTAASLVEAAKKIGWQSRIIDPKGDPAAYAPSIREAVAAKADAIVTCAIDANTIAPAVKEAKAAGVVVIGGFSRNEDELFEYAWPEKQDLVDAGYAIAAASYLANDERLNPVLFEAREFGVTHDRQAGTEDFISECKSAGGNCSVVAKQNILVTELATTAPQTAVNLMTANPTADAVWTGHDPMMSAIEPALAAAGLTKGRIGMSFDGNSSNIAKMKSGGLQQFDIGAPMEWVGYGQVDTLIRLFAGQKPVDQGYRLKLLNKENSPASGDWNGDSDVVPAYEKLWGLGS